MMPSAALSHYVYNPNPQITIPRPSRSEICVIILPYLFFLFF